MLKWDKFHTHNLEGFSNNQLFWKMQLTASYSFPAPNPFKFPILWHSEWSTDTSVQIPLWHGPLWPLRPLPHSSQPGTLSSATPNSLQCPSSTGCSSLMSLCPCYSFCLECRCSVFTWPVPSPLLRLSWTSPPPRNFHCNLADFSAPLLCPNSIPEISLSLHIPCRVTSTVDETAIWLKPGHYSSLYSIV